MFARGGGGARWQAGAPQFCVSVSHTWLLAKIACTHSPTPLTISQTKQVPSASRKQLRPLLALPLLDLNVRGPNGRTPLMLAVERGQPGILSDLLATGRVDLAARDSSGATAVLLAARSADAAVLRILLDAGAGAGMVG